MEEISISIGPYEVRTINFGNFLLDGGAMFGSCPKTIWNTLIPADELNRIKLATRCLYITGDNKQILVDLGNGKKWSDKHRNIYGIEYKDIDITRELITDVILTHLHFDHAGGISFLDDQGKLLPTYPNATIHIQKSNIQNAKAPTRKEKASYLSENVGALEFYTVNELDGPKEILPGIKVHLVSGHTRGQQWIEIYDKHEHLYFPTDLIPTSHHIHPAFHMGYDNCAETVMREKETFLLQAEKHNALIVFEHDVNVVCGRLRRDEKGSYYIAKGTEK